jgi:hypothetical protein
MPSLLESAVELYRGKKRAVQFEVLVGTAQFFDLTLEGFDVLLFGRGYALTLAGVCLMPAQPSVHLGRFKIL